MRWLRDAGDGAGEMILSVTIQLRTVSETNVREHWSARHKRRKRQRFHVWNVLYAHPVKVPFPCVVTMTRISPRALDGHDNLRASLKAPVDAVAGWLGTDDADPRITWRYAQERGGVREHAVRIEVSE